METSNPNQTVQGPSLQDTQKLQTGQQTNGLQEQNNYKQLQQEALGSDAYRNFDGLQVRQGQESGNAPMTMKAGPKDSGWPSPWLLVLAVLAVGAVAVFYKRQNGAKPKKAVATSGVVKSTASKDESSAKSEAAEAPKAASKGAKSAKKPAKSKAAKSSKKKSGKKAKK